MNKLSYDIDDIVYFVTDVENESFMVTGKVDRGDHYTYLVSNKHTEKECSEKEISNLKNYL